mgnify:CR=1 FL=1
MARGWVKAAALYNARLEERPDTQPVPSHIRARR